MFKKRTIKRFQRTFAVLGLLVVLSSLFVVPVQAAEYEGHGVFHVYGYSYSGSNYNVYYSQNSDYFPIINHAYTDFYFNSNNYVSSLQIGLPYHSFTSVVDIYFSFYPYIVQDYPLSRIGTPYDASSWKAYYKNETGRYGESSVIDASRFVPVTSNFVNPYGGVSVRASYVGSEGLPITDLRLGLSVFDSVSNTFYPVREGWRVHPDSPFTPLYWYVTSLRVITTESTADSEAIADVANQIGAMSDLLNAKLGDIAQIVQLIYENTNDINVTLEICKGYFEAMLDSLESIDGTVIDIYSLLDTQFRMLISAINTASANIKGAIEQQTEDMQEYFDNVFGSAVNDDLTGETENIQSGMDNVDNAEQGYISTATDRFDGIVGSFTGFNGGVASGVSLVSTLFERVWTSFGEYIIVYSFPLSLGLVLLLIGRISRSDGSNRDDDGNMGTPRLPGHK